MSSHKLNCHSYIHTNDTKYAASSLILSQRNTCTQLHMQENITFYINPATMYTRFTVFFLSLGQKYIYLYDGIHFSLPEILRISSCGYVLDVHLRDFAYIFSISHITGLWSVDRNNLANVKPSNRGQVYVEQRRISTELYVARIQLRYTQTHFLPYFESREKLRVFQFFFCYAQGE